jgi:hypothetical protein
VVASVSNSDLCCKSYREGTGGEVWIETANPAHPLMLITGQMELRIIGLATFCVQWHAKRYGRRLRLVDCNSYYASRERAFDPKLIGRPVVVLSNNDGCIITGPHMRMCLQRPGRRIIC